MTRAGNHTGFWRSVRELPERTPLRVKLITALLALVAIALLVISVAGISYIRGYLLSRADSSCRCWPVPPRATVMGPDHRPAWVPRSANGA